jgi:hypothetical protein
MIFLFFTKEIYPPVLRIFVVVKKRNIMKTEKKGIFHL